MMTDAQIDAANREVIERIFKADVWVIGLSAAREAVAGLGDRFILHAGPPVAWDEMVLAMRGAVTGALVYEGWAPDLEEADRLAASGRVRFASAHDHGFVGPMAGVVSPSMPVFVFENRACGNRAFATLNEGLGKALRFGANSLEVLDRLRWMRDVLSPALAVALSRAGPLDVRAMMAEALHRGDEVHNRNKAGTALFLKTLFPALARSVRDAETVARVAEFIGGNDHFFLNLSIGASKATLDAAHGVRGSSVVTALAANGRRVGIRVSGLGDRWFTAAARVARGKFFPGYTEADANPDMGDSYISEMAGTGGFAMAAAPAIVSFVGGTPSEALNYTLRMYEITLGEHPLFTIPALDYRGTPTGVDVRKVAATGILPFINTGIAHREAGVGQVGAGLAQPPLSMFEDAVCALRAL